MPANKKVVPILTDEQLIMQDTPEMRSLSTREALSRKNQMEARGVTANMTAKQVDKKIIELCNIKAELTGQPASTFALGQERYVANLVLFAKMSKFERYQWGKLQAFPEVANASEILDAL